jgi:hypothetical protein
VPIEPSRLFSNSVDLKNSRPELAGPGQPVQASSALGQSASLVHLTRVRAGLGPEKKRKLADRSQSPEFPKSFLRKGISAKHTANLAPERTQFRRILPSGTRSPGAACLAYSFVESKPTFIISSHFWCASTRRRNAQVLEEVLTGWR